MNSPADHIDDLIRHITLVRNACVLLGRRLMREGQVDFGRMLIARGHQHDQSKFFGIEWNYLHAGPDTPREKLDLAIEQHVETNDHHPEFWGGVDHMPPLAVAEMVCDWYARSQERGEGLRQWVTDVGMQKYGIVNGSPAGNLIAGYLRTLLLDPFVRNV